MTPNRYVQFFILTLMLLASPARAETIDAKYVGAIDLASYECTETSSSFVHRICYDADESHVVVLLQEPEGQL